MSKKRFTITKGLFEERVTTFDTLEEVHQWGRSNDEEWIMNDHYVKDNQEDMEVLMDDLMEAFARGERPLDLYHF
jgi:hypothetical protein